MRLTPRSCTRYIESATVVSSYENKTATHLDRSKPWSDYRRSTKSSPRKACLSVCTRRRDHDHTETMAASGSRWAMILHKYPLTVGTRSFFLFLLFISFFLSRYDEWKSKGNLVAGWKGWIEKLDCSDCHDIKF